MGNFFKNIKNVLLPPEFKRPYSVLAYILGAISTGILGAFGVWIFNNLIITNAKKITVPVFDFVFRPLFSVSLFYVLTYSIFFIIISKYIERKFFKGKEGTLIFEEKFESIGSGWVLNYWGSNNPSKTNKIENGTIIFEATEDDLQNKDKEFGAYYDLSSGIFEGNEYEVICKVKADPNTTMKFQLWIHDDIRGAGSKVRVRYPEPPRTPPENFEFIKARFVANASNAMRIHLHNRGGTGRIIVDDVRVIKI